jgi:hypothetical protein
MSQKWVSAGPMKSRLLDVSEIKPLSEATKYDSEKVRVELIPSSAINGIGEAFTFGASKYEDNNWAKGFAWSRLVGSTLRHILAWNNGDDLDPESKLSHLKHAGACIAMLIAHEAEKLGTDDRRKVK